MSYLSEIPKEMADALEAFNGTTSRRDFLKSSGLFVLSFSGTGLLETPGSDSGEAPENGTAAPYPEPDFRLLDSWLVVHEDSTATFYVGKTDGGQGTGTAFRQMMCDELDIAFEKSTLVMGRTDMTVDQGGSGGSDAIERDGWAVRRVAAEARRVLLGLASGQPGRALAGPAFRGRVVSATRGPARTGPRRQALRRVPRRRPRRTRCNPGSSPTPGPDRRRDHCFASHDRIHTSHTPCRVGGTGE